MTDPQQPTPEAVRLMHRARTTHGTVRFVYDDKEIATDIDRFAAQREAGAPVSGDAREVAWEILNTSPGMLVPGRANAEKLAAALTAAAAKARREAITQLARAEKVIEAARAILENAELDLQDGTAAPQEFALSAAIAEYDRPPTPQNIGAAASESGQ